MDTSSESLNFSNASNTEKQMYLYPKMASRLEQNLSLKTLGYLLFIPAIFFSFFFCFYLLFGCPMANFWLLSSKKYHSPSVDHCIWASSFWARAGMGGAGSLHLTECPLSFDYNAITPQIAENTLPRLKPSSSKVWKCPQYPKQV